MISLVVAMDKNNGIGLNNKLLWKIPEDMKHFRRLTMNGIIIMGRKTFESIGHPLHKRTNIVLSRTLQKLEGCYVYPSLSELLHDYEQASSEEEVFVIGGEEIYIQFLPFADRLYVTHVDASFDADAHFPTIDTDKWEMVSNGISNEDHELNYTFAVYQKRR